jgi:hypothetical protein
MSDPVQPNLRLFVAEDLSKPENRTNVWLIAAMGIESFWMEFSKEVGICPECTVAPMQWPGRRPDLTVLRKGQPVAVVECENFGANNSQNEAYKVHCNGLRLIQVLGDGAPAADITWSRVKEIAKDAKKQSSPHQGVTLDLLAAAVDHASGLLPKSVMRWLDRPRDLPKDPWLLNAAAPLLALPHDVVRAHSAAEGSASIRLLKPRSLIRAGRSGIGMAMIQAGRPMTVFLPSPEHLGEHLDDTLCQWIREWKDMLNELVPGFIPDGRRLITVHTRASPAIKAEMVAACFRSLISLLRADAAPQL